MSTPGLVLLDEDDPEYPKYQAVELPRDWRSVTVPAGPRGAGRACRWAWDFYKDADWVGNLADDLVPVTEKWDATLVSRLNGANLIGADDERDAPHHLRGCVIFSGDLFRAWGWIYPNGFNHLCVDDVWETIGEATGCWDVAMDVLVKHVHGGIHSDDTYRAVNSTGAWGRDLEFYESWLRNGEKDEACARTKRLMAAKGWRGNKPDLSGMSILIATPSIDGRSDEHYNLSLQNTIALIRECGGQAWQARMRGCSEICSARNMLAAAFLRSPHTHLWFIDDDIGWEPRDLVRLSATREDFVAAAGPKKTPTAEFACTATTLEVDERGLAPVPRVGLAFAMISRRCLDKVNAAHPELEYGNGLADSSEFAVFDNIIIDKERMSEGYSFCERWRALGGTVWVDPEVSLSHTGGHTFAGKLSDVFKVK